MASNNPEESAHLLVTDVIVIRIIPYTFAGSMGCFAAKGEERTAEEDNGKCEAIQHSNKARGFNRSIKPGRYVLEL